MQEDKRSTTEPKLRNSAELRKSKSKNREREKNSHLPNKPSPSPECGHGYSTCMFTATAGSLEGLPLNNHRKALALKRSATHSHKQSQSLTSSDFHSLAPLFAFANSDKDRGERSFHSLCCKQESPSEACLH